MNLIRETVMNLNHFGEGPSLVEVIPGHVFNLRKEQIRESFEVFDKVEHRLEYLRTVEDISYVNDSRSTGANCTWYSLQEIKGPIVWIGGGKDHGIPYEDLLDLVITRVRSIVCLSANPAKFSAAFSSSGKRIVHTTAMDQAVKMARAMALPGDTVLLSPSASSLDLFEGYEERGRQFKKAVRDI